MCSQHGYDPRYSEMKAIFYAGGPDFRERRLAEVNNIDAAPTVADLLEIKPPADAQGKKIARSDRDGDETISRPQSPYFSRTS
jgi:arylsulfatase A-like enzyme